MIRNGTMCIEGWLALINEPCDQSDFVACGG